MVGFFVSMQNGLFLWSPIVLVAAAGTNGIWRSLPSWTRSALLASLLYIVLHARLNRVSGVIPFGYRYALEPLFLAAPALTLGALNAWRDWRKGIRLIVVALDLSVVFQVPLVTQLQCNDTGAGFTNCAVFGTVRWDQVDLATVLLRASCHGSDANSR